MGLRTHAMISIQGEGFPAHSYTWIPAARLPVLSSKWYSLRSSQAWSREDLRVVPVRPDPHGRYRSHRGKVDQTLPPRTQLGRDLVCL